MTDAIESSSDRVCLNCGQPMGAEYCAHCGQQEKEVRRPFIIFIQEFLWVVFELDGRAYRTLFNLLARPGFLTQEYFAGRRVKYTPPLRLFLIVSIGFFLLVSLFTAVDGIRQDMLDIASAGSSEVLTETDADTDDDDPGETGLDELPESEDYEEVIALLEQVNLPFLAEQTNANLRTVLTTQFEANIQELIDDPRDFLSQSLEYVTFFMLLMMPVLALMQQILWVLSRRYYIEHLVLTVHNHAFLILMVFLTMLLGMVEDASIGILSTAAGWLSTAAVIWIIIYLYLSLKRFMQAGWFVTLLLFTVASIAYSIVVSMGLLTFALLLVLFA